ncbi:MAG: transporter [candidate division WOR-3 bacterium]
MRKSLVLAVCLVGIAGTASGTALLGRTGSVVKPMQLLAWVNFGYNKSARTYNWDSASYVTPAGFLPRTTVSADVILGLGLARRLEVGAVMPFAAKRQGEYSSSGLGDVMLNARYAFLANPLSPVKAALALGVNFPTAGRGQLLPIGDRTTDVGLGLCAHTARLGPLIGHARGAYWFNGKTDSIIKIGNMFEYVVNFDFVLSQVLTPQVALSGYMIGQNLVRGTPVAHTEVSQHVVNALLLVKLAPSLVFRPKVALPVYKLSRGGSYPNFYVGVDVWVVVP